MCGDVNNCVKCWNRFVAEMEAITATAIGVDEEKRIKHARNHGYDNDQ